MNIGLLWATAVVVNSFTVQTTKQETSTIQNRRTACPAESLRFGNSLQRLCKHGNRYSALQCKCVPKRSRIPRASRPIVVVQYRLLEEDDNVSCRPYFRFIFDRTAHSDDNSVISIFSNKFTFEEFPGSTGKTSAKLNGDGTITIPAMTAISFAKKFKFIIQFRTVPDYHYLDGDYFLFGEGACGDMTPSYSVFINPLNNSISGVFQLKDKSVIYLRLDNVSFTDWVLLFLIGVNKELRMFTDSSKDYSMMGDSNLQSPSCPMEIGRNSIYDHGFVGYFDSIEFMNCYN